MPEEKKSEETVWLDKPPEEEEDLEDEQRIDKCFCPLCKPRELPSPKEKDVELQTRDLEKRRKQEAKDSII